MWSMAPATACRWSARTRWRRRFCVSCERARMSDLSVAAEGVLPDKRQVAASFSRAAETYDAVAELQRGVGESLLARLPSSTAPQRWVDLGCGTGYFSRALGQQFSTAEGFAVDIAEGMLRHSASRGGARHFIGGDAERLPLRDECSD